MSDDTREPWKWAPRTGPTVLMYGGGIAGYTNDDGVFVWGNPAVQAEEGRRAAIAREAAAIRHAANVSYDADKEAGRVEAGQDYRAGLLEAGQTYSALPYQAEHTTPAESAARDLWENVELEPSPTIEHTHDRSRER